MSDEVSSPLLTLIKEQSLIDDLQYEEVLAEFKPPGKPISQVLQDFGVMDLDSILQVIANHLGTEVVSLQGRPITPELLQLVPGNMARMYQCLPVGLSNSTLQVALVDPLNPARIDELGYVVKKDIQLVVVDPAQIQKAIEQYYPGDTDSVSDILKELGSDTEIAREVSELGEGATEAMVAGLANEAPIVRF